MFTAYRFDNEAIKNLAAQNAANLQQNRGLSDYAGFATKVISDRLAKGARRYLDYGPYWWAVKDVLKRAGEDLGDDDDIQLREAYRGETDAETLTMADLFRQKYLSENFLGHNQYVLTDSGETWTIIDDDMEELALASA